MHCRSRSSPPSATLHHHDNHDYGNIDVGDDHSNCDVGDDDDDHHGNGDIDDDDDVDGRTMLCGRGGCEDDSLLPFLV